MSAMKHFGVILIVSCLLLTFASTKTNAAESAQQPFLTGVNLGMAQGGNKLPGKNGKDYLWATPRAVDMYADWGVNVLRIPFLWERMQPELMGELSFTESGHLDQVVREAARRKVTVLLDPHNYGSYRRDLIGSAGVPVAAFTDFWRRLAERYKDNPYIAFGLMNEPNKQSAKEWAAIAQAALLAIRETGAKQLILVPGSYWTGAHSWVGKRGGNSNAEALADIRDPANNFAFEMHQYFDSNSSGMHPDCEGPDVGVKRLAAATEWLKKTGHKGFLAEFGASKDPVCLEALARTLAYMRQNADAWAGWTYWAASPWFGNYMFNVYPPDPERFPQVSVLEKALNRQESP